MKKKKLHIMIFLIAISILPIFLISNVKAISYPVIPFDTDTYDYVIFSYNSNINDANSFRLIQVPKSNYIYLDQFGLRVLSSLNGSNSFISYYKLTNSKWVKDSSTYSSFPLSYNFTFDNLENSIIKTSHDINWFNSSSYSLVAYPSDYGIDDSIKPNKYRIPTTFNPDLYYFVNYYGFYTKKLYTYYILKSDVSCVPAIMTYNPSNGSNNLYKDGIVNAFRSSCDSSILQFHQLINGVDSNVITSNLVDFTTSDDTVNNISIYGKKNTFQLASSSRDFTLSEDNLIRTSNYISLKSIKISHVKRYTSQTMSNVSSVSIDFTDYWAHDYVYQYSYDNSNWFDVTPKTLYYDEFLSENVEHCLGRGCKSLKLYYDFDVSFNTNLYARVLDLNGNLISSNSITIDDLLTMDGYTSYTFPLNKKYAVISKTPKKDSIYVLIDKNSSISSLGTFNYNTKVFDNTGISPIDSLNSTFFRYDYDLTNISDTVLVLQLNDTGQFKTFFVPNGSYVTFSNNIWDEDNNFTVPICYKDDSNTEVCTLSEVQNTTINSNDSSFFTSLKKYLSNFNSTFAFIGLFISNLLSSLPTSINLALCLSFGFIVLSIIIKIWL